MNQRNDLEISLMGTGSNLGTYTGHSSASRIQMFCSHLTQALVVEGSTPKRIQTGAEEDYGKYTFKIEMPVDASIIKVIEKYPRKAEKDSIKENPVLAVIYEDYITKEVGVLEIQKYFCIHTNFGFKYVYNDQAMGLLAPGAFVPKGTVFAHSPNLKKGTYCYGIETNVALMSIPQVIEDGFVISKSYAEKLAVQGIETRVKEFGKEYYPLNLYGDLDNYKPFPDIGEQIRSDGLLMVLRKYDELSAFNEMTPRDLLPESIDYVYDILVYATPGATVYDINVDRDFTLRYPECPIGMEPQAAKYESARSQYYSKLLTEYNRLKKTRKEHLSITPKFHRLLREAIGGIDPASKPNAKGPTKIRRMYRRKPIENWRVEVKFAKRIVPTLGWKLSDEQGSKGVVSQIWEDHRMPVDQFGRRADLIMDDVSVVKRLNSGQLFIQYISNSADQVSRKVREMYPIAGFEKTWDYLTGWYKIASPFMWDEMERHLNTDALRKQHIQSVMDDGVYLYCPPNSPNLGVAQVEGLQQHYPLEFGPVTYTGCSGKQTTTVDSIMIASKYMILLEAIPDKWSSVATAKLQHFGIPALLTDQDKYSYPVREQPVKLLGEDEVRLFNATIGPDATSEMLDRSNSPVTNKNVLENIYHADKPTAIHNAVDREKVGRGLSRPLVYVGHELACGGIKLVEQEYEHND